MSFLDWLFGSKRGTPLKTEEVQSIEIIDNQSKHCLMKFERQPMAKIDMERWIELPEREAKEYREVISGSLVSNLGSRVVETGGQVGSIAALAPNGLYSATISPASLMTYTNGTIGALVTVLRKVPLQHAPPILKLKPHPAPRLPTT